MGLFSHHLQPPCLVQLPQSARRTCLCCAADNRPSPPCPCPLPLFSHHLQPPCLVQLPQSARRTCLPAPADRFPGIIATRQSVSAGGKSATRARKGCSSFLACCAADSLPM